MSSFIQFAFILGVANKKKEKTETMKKNELIEREAIQW